MAANLGQLADAVRAALSSGDLEAYQHLLAPDAHWGPSDSPEWGCHNRNEILAWYKASKRNGMAASVTEVVVGTGALLVGLEVTGREDDGPRWQVLTVQDGLITDICGFDSRDEAADRAGASRA